MNSQCYRSNFMKKIIYVLAQLLLITLLSSTDVAAQVVIGGTIPDSSAALEIQSSNMGFLLPRMSTSNRDAIRNPATGLMIFNTSTLCAEMNIGTPSLPEWLKMGCRTGGVTGLDCAQITVSDTIFVGKPVNNVQITVPYTGGNGGAHSAVEFHSTGALGLTASLPAGNFSFGDGTLVLDVTGTTFSSENAIFVIQIGDNQCELLIDIYGEIKCGALIAPGVWREFMCYNLGSSSYSVDPTSPSWEIIGGYWIWGLKSMQAQSPTRTESNSAEVPYWYSSKLYYGNWSDESKSYEDPCPVGYRLPSSSHWQGVIDNNTWLSVGDWNPGPVNYSSGKLIGNNLFLPASGYRDQRYGELYGRGESGVYMSSTYNRIGPNSNFVLSFRESNQVLTYDYFQAAGTVRCILDEPASIDALDCNSVTVNGTLKQFERNQSVLATLNYSGGNGVYSNYFGTESTGVTGLHMNIIPNYLAYGDGALVFSIDGTPSEHGIATFTIQIGSNSCVINIPVAPVVCGAYIAPGLWKEFMCHNLGVANTSADPFTPSWEINGGYWQWGRKEQAAEGPSGPGAGETNEGAVNGWVSASAPDGSWSDGAKTGNDPCPSGYRVPTQAEWDSIKVYNTRFDLGQWYNTPLNCSSGQMIGNNLMLPAAGYRNSSEGVLVNRGYYGSYWSSSQNSNNEAWHYQFINGSTSKYADFFTYGVSVRCISEAPASNKKN